MKKLQRISFPIVVLTALGLVIHFYMFSFPDWAVRSCGILLLVSMFGMVFSTVRITMSK